MMNHLLVCVVIALASLSAVDCRNKFQVCVVDGRGGFRRAARYCPVLDGPDSKVECVIGLDRLDCLRRISKGKADFAVFTPEDLVTASNLRVEVLVTNEMRFSKDDFEYQVVAVISDDSRIKNRYDLRDKKFCHPGYGYEADWTQILANYLEVSIVPQSCNSMLTLTENRIKSSSKYFKAACKAGPWVHEPTLDSELKKKYPNLCELCNTPYLCSTEDKYWGRRGPLLCLTDGVGDITWARLDDVSSHFGINPGSALSSPDGYSYLCPDGTTIPLNSSTAPCVWVSKPWPIIGSKRTSAQEIQEFVSSLSYSDSNSWQSALLNLIESYHVDISKVDPIEAIESYLARAPGFLSANSFPGCHPPRTIKVCTTSNLENTKCSWLREAATVYGIEPDIDCLKADNKSHCMQGVVDNLVDVVVVPPDMVHGAKTKYNLKTLFYETTNDDEKYITVAIVKANSDIKSLDDLKGKKACFPIYDGIAWNSVIHALQNKKLLQLCPFANGIADFFGDSCVPNLPNKTLSNLYKLCKEDMYVGDYGAMRCLTHENADVAFLSKNAFTKYFKDLKQKGNFQVSETDYSILCENINLPCHLSWAPVGQVMVKHNNTDLWSKDTLDVFLQMDTLFGKNYKSLTTPFTMFGLYDGQTNILFHDSTVKLRNVPTIKNTDKMNKQYDDILNDIQMCTTATGTGAPILPTITVAIYFIICMFI